MPPTGREVLRSRVQELLEKNPVMVFSKSYCPYCDRVKELFTSLGKEYFALELDQCDDGSSIQEVLHEMTGQKTVPNVFVNKTHVGGCDKTLQAHQDGTLQKLLDNNSVTYDYDLIVIGGGSGGLACSKEASALGKKVMVLDFVVPTPMGSSWGLGGTCVNVGCIPKKLMHQAALLGQALKDSRKFGWEYDEQVKHNWETMRDNIQNYIGSLNWGYRVALRDKNVRYENAYGEFVEPHKIKATNKRGKESFFTGEKFVIATGERPRYLNIPGDKEYCITSFFYDEDYILTCRCDYINVPTTVFTPMEYGCCGYSEEKAIEIFGEETLEVYHTLFWPLGMPYPGGDNNTCFAKIICNKLDNDRVIGFHVLGPNAGEITQGFGAAMKCGLTKEKLDETIGIHPTCAETFTTMEVTKSSGGDITQKGC
ncbi:LOW QUALITY PROTEIN: thioredoxin reductase 3 [Hyla sarda]|uniref:LOW QUALITY PROTEIN: thioredoxin reductase 3 n=1 Tax=Hyla sarda TaxID=327740 RepID=UPI0024C2D999|nr:LOW QUALITY PROTEIN: thioredoxin reductase 3 [Hyla sarda]